MKLSAPLATGDVSAESMADAVERGLADATVVSGLGTGHGVDVAELEAAVETREAFDLEVPVLVGSGVTPGTVGEVLSIADGAVVGTALKEDGDVANPVSERRVRELVEAADR